MQTARYLSLILLLITYFNINASEEDDSDYFSAQAQKSGGALKKKDAMPGKSVKLFSYSLTMYGTEDAASGSSFLITVFWNNEVYESILYDPPASGTHTFEAFESFKYNDYNYFDSPGTKAKMLIRNNANNDAAIFTSMRLTLEDGTFYEVDSFCGNPLSLGSYYSNFEIPDSGIKHPKLTCPDGQKQYEAVCIDGNPGLACNPSNLMVYFDKRNPNTVSINAPILDATGKVMEGCEMLINPSMSYKCANKETPAECEKARTCNLVIRTFGTEFKKENKELGVMNGNLIGLDTEFNDSVLWVIFGISASINVFYCVANIKKKGKLNGDFN